MDMDRIARVHAGRIMHYMMGQKSIRWESPFGFQDYGVSWEILYIDIIILVVGLSEGFWHRRLQSWKQRMRMLVEREGFHTYIRQFRTDYFERKTADDMHNVLTMIMYILESSVDLYSRNRTEAAMIGVRVLAEVLQGYARNQEELDDRFNELHATALEMIRDPAYSILDILEVDDESD